MQTVTLPCIFNDNVSIYNINPKFLTLMSSLSFHVGKKTISYHRMAT